MTLLTAAEPSFDEPTWRREQRAGALAIFRDRGLPDPEDEVWKYAPLEHLSLEDVEVASPQGTTAATAIGGRSPAAVVLIDAGALGHAEVHADGLTITAGPVEGLGELVGPDDAFSALNLALTPGPVVIDVAAGVVLERPVVVLVGSPVGASFPRVLVRLGRGARARVLEHVTGEEAGLVCGVAEYVVAEDAALSVCTVESLGRAAWSLCRTRGSLARAATLSQTVVGLGGLYDRVRADAVLEGEGAASVLTTAHVGRGDQVHDLRTMQVHRGRRTTSRLRSKAAVAGRSGSVYSGLIAMRHGARRADASQVNSSLVLSGHAYADAIPNLDIEENDVRCTHASSVGPIDEEQRWYLGSRGVAPSDAIQLILEGFFADVEALLDDAVLAAQLRDAVGELEPEGEPSPAVS